MLLAKELGEYLINLMQGHQPQGKEVTEQLSLFSLYSNPVYLYVIQQLIEVHSHNYCM
ncbi:MAG: hypothetical protein PT118_17945 [Aphanizomenon gracile PMC644.10]|nr:hypothetical protein [Aphanizomenon gracile PMC644.10]